MARELQDECKTQAQSMVLMLLVMDWGKTEEAYEYTVEDNFALVARRARGPHRSDLSYGGQHTMGALWTG